MLDLYEWIIGWFTMWQCPKCLEVWTCGTTCPNDGYRRWNWMSRKVYD